MIRYVARQRAWAVAFTVAIGTMASPIAAQGPAAYPIRIAYDAEGKMPDGVKPPADGFRPSGPGNAPTRPTPHA